ncbi:MAG: alpha-1,4-glucan--maltose-1-phosphate maltosyltransferase [Burkholderiales bacterium]
MSEESRQRVVIEKVAPEVDAGRFPIKRIEGETVVVETDAFADGNEVLRCMLKYRREQEAQWTEVEMAPLANDRWRGQFTVTAIGRYRYTVTAWVDRFLSWRHDFSRRTEPEDITIALLAGAKIVAAAVARAQGHDAERLNVLHQALLNKTELERRCQIGLSQDLAQLMARNPDRRNATVYGRELVVTVDPVRARFSAWYELFPRSTSEAAGVHGTFKDCEARLPYIVAMGFDVLYLPPIHPIGRVQRKGPDNTLLAAAESPGSPWAIGAREGGHKAIHPQLGGAQDFRHLVAKARAHGIEIALDIAFQCAPDHPYVKEHPDWFCWRPDGSVQYAENPPKKYQDIYPFNFETEAWRELFEELKSIFLHWIAEGVTIFRVDNPHTKPFALWEWLIGEVKREHPQIIFLSEAFTRPKVMHRLAKLGFTQSYTYFAWRNTRSELTEYLTELTQQDTREYFLPNLWPNTPDILTEYLQFGGRPAFMTRLVLAATLGASYGIYGPAYELAENTPRDPGGEEYLNSEKYGIRQWDLNRADSLKDFIGRINRIRRDNPALQHDWNLKFYPVTNEELICYGKTSDDLGNVIIIVVNLDPYHTQSGWVELPLSELDIDAEHPYQVCDLLTGAHYLWHGARNYVKLDPHQAPAHILCLRRRVHGERDFDYFM